MSIKIVKITKKDIDKVSKLNHYNVLGCPVARAFNRTFKNKVAAVDGSGMVFLKNFDIFINNEDMKIFVKKFDDFAHKRSEHKPDPITINLNIIKNQEGDHEIVTRVTNENN